MDLGSNDKDFGLGCTVAIVVVSMALGSAILTVGLALANWIRPVAVERA